MPPIPLLLGSEQPLTIANMKKMVGKHIQSKHDGSGSKKVFGTVLEVWGEKTDLSWMVMAKVRWNTMDVTTCRLAGTGRLEPWSFPNKQLSLGERGGVKTVALLRQQYFPATSLLAAEKSAPLFLAPHASDLHSDDLKMALG